MHQRNGIVTTGLLCNGTGMLDNGTVNRATTPTKPYQSQALKQPSESISEIGDTQKQQPTEAPRSMCQCASVPGKYVPYFVWNKSSLRAVL